MYLFSILTFYISDKKGESNIWREGLINNINRQLLDVQFSASSPSDIETLFFYFLPHSFLIFLLLSEFAYKYFVNADYFKKICYLKSCWKLSTKLNTSVEIV
jgi:hypothetical protein